jgi:predicted SnoaL-like aldol condensation-catalyzing enzyme
MKTRPMGASVTGIRPNLIMLAECSLYDKKRGIGIDINDPDRLVIAKWKGKNLLGRILMEVREELRQEIQSSPHGKVEYVDARDLEPIKEWNMTAGELKRIPQFYNAIHAYSDTLRGHCERDVFYNGYFDGDTYIQHNTGIADGLSGLGAALEALGKQGIQMIYDNIHQVLAQGNYVLAVSEGTFGGTPTSYYDLWRVENGKVAEHWDVMETIADKETWQNQNGKF